MKKYIILLFIFLVSNCFSQEKETIVVQKFVENYNNSEYALIFSMFSDSMKKAVSFDDLKAFLEKTKLEEGNIVHNRFIRSRGKDQFSYFTNLKNGVRILNIILDANSSIDGITFKPYVKGGFAKNNLTVKEGLLNKKQIKLLYDKVKVFPNDTQIALGIIKKGEVSFVGVERKNNVISYIENSKSVFEIASITKVFTATLLADFVLNKKVNLKDYINNYLSFPLKDNIKITFKELANHTSGLSLYPSNLNLQKNPKNPYKEYSNSDLEEYLMNSLELQKQSKNQFLYSNLGFALLGYTLGKIDNNNYNELLKENIFRKYGMNNSTASLKEVDDVLLVPGLDKNGNVTPNWERQVLEGNGAVLSNVKDLSKFMLAQFNGDNTELSLTQKETYKIDEYNSVGLGWLIKNNKSKLHWHNGATGGYKSCMAIDVLNKKGVIILSNVSSENLYNKNIENLCFGLIKSL